MATDPGNHVWIANFNPTTYLLTISEFSDRQRDDRNGAVPVLRLWAR